MKLKQWLILKKISQSDLARHLGMSRCYVNIVLNDRIKPGRRFVDVIFAFTDGDVKPEDFGLSEYVPNKIVVRKMKSNVIDL